MNKTRVLITGASGFIGSHLDKKLTQDGYLVTRFRGDLRKKTDIQKNLQKSNPAYIYHLGAVVDLSRSYLVAKKCIEINLKGTLNLLESLHKSKIQKFIYTSTEEVYGKNKLPYSEDHLPHPPSPYAITKIASEQFIWQYANELGFDAYIFRIGTVYGPGQIAGTRLIPTIIDKALKNEDIPLNSGLKKRDYIYIDDVVTALTKVLSLKKSGVYEIINLGGGKHYSLREMMRIILRLTDSKSKPLYGAFPDRALEAEEWMLDIKKANKILNWRPKVSLEEGLKKTIKTRSAEKIKRTRYETGEGLR